MRLETWPLYGRRGSQSHLCYDLSHVTYVFHPVLILTQTIPAGDATLQVASA